MILISYDIQDDKLRKENKEALENTWEAKSLAIINLLKKYESKNT